MTVQDMCIDIWEQLGEPTDLQPGTLDAAGDLTFDISSDGAVKLLGWINRAITAICTWEDPKTNERIRFPSLDETYYFQGYELTGTGAGGSSSTIVLAATASSTDDYYNGMVVEITSGTGSGQERFIVDYDGATQTATVNRNFDTTPDATSVYAINKDFYLFRESGDSDASENIVVRSKYKTIAPLAVRDLETRTELSYKERTDSFIGQRDVNGIPTIWYWEGNGIRFNVAPEDTRWYEVDVRIVPADLSAASDETELPDNFDEAIILWCVIRGIRPERDAGYAYSLKRDFFDLMRSLQDGHDMITDEVEAGLRVYNPLGGF